MTTVEMEVALMRYFKFTQKLVVPNVTDMSGLVRFETDLLVLTKSRYATGVEIKVSKADFQNEFKKRQYQYGEEMDEIFYGMFKNFYFAFPEALIEECIADVPSRFGVLSVNKKGRVEEIRASELLYNKKWSEKDYNKLMRIGCMRIYNLKRNLIK